MKVARVIIPPSSQSGCGTSVISALGRVEQLTKVALGGNDAASPSVGQLDGTVDRTEQVDVELESDQ